MKALTASGAPDAWIGAHRDELAELLREHGALHINGTDVADAAVLAAVRDAYGATPVPLTEQFAIRADLGHGVYSAPQWAGDREMCHHHEQSYAATYPALLFVAGIRPARSGGARLLADTRRMLDQTPPGLRERFAAHGWLLIRNYRPYLGLSWTTALGVATPDEADALCAHRDIQAEWGRDRSLRTGQRRPAVIEHPVTGEPCWFNDVAFFSQWSVDAAERAVLLKAYGDRGIPLNTFSGDGAPVTEDEFQDLLAAYDRVTERVDLRPGELLILDNVLTAHGREPYTGDLELAIAPADG